MKSAFPADLVTFTGEILNGKLHFWGSVENKNANENRGKNRKISIIDVWHDPQPSRLYIPLITPAVKLKMAENSINPINASAALI